MCEMAFRVESEELKTGAGQMDMYSCGLGGLMYLDSSNRPPTIIEKSSVPNDLDIVIVDTLTPRSTAEVIKAKRIRYSEKESSILKYVEKTLASIESIRKLMQEDHLDIEKLGRSITQCHYFLRDYMKVSTDLLNKCVEISIENGALGAKLTGTGMGGCMFCIAQNNKVEGIIKKLKQLNVKVYKTKLLNIGLN